MANQNPTGDGAGTTLSIADGDRAFLRRLFSAASIGLREELDRFGDQLREPLSSLLDEEAAYGCLLDGLDGAVVYPDEAMLEAAGGLAEAVDRENQYSRVVAEHEAMNGLLGQLQGAVA